MKRSGFTMIELIFVIVILGILAAVAVPRLAGVQDDALGATEKSTVGAMRGGVQALYGKIMMNKGQTDLNVTALSSDGTQYKIQYDLDVNDAVTGVINSRPIGLTASGSGATDNNTPQITATLGNADTNFAAVLDPGSDRGDWEAKAINTTETKMVGPASRTVDANSDAEYTQAGSWLYKPSAGTITWRGDEAYSTDN